MSFKNKVIIVTGGSSGIGAATAILFAKEGADVVITGRNEDNLNSVAEQCTQVGKKPLIVKADVSKDNEAASIIEKTIDKFGKLDVLVNNAGIFKLFPILHDDAVSKFDEVMNTNVRAVVVMTHAAGPHLIKSKGNIVNVSSVAATRYKPYHSAYTTSKAALTSFSRLMAMELSDSGVRVNVVSPGPVETPIFDRSGSVITEEHLKSITALNKISKPEEIAEVIAFLASDKAGSVTGSDYFIDCGTFVKG